MEKGVILAILLGIIIPVILTVIMINIYINNACTQIGPCHTSDFINDFRTIVGIIGLVAFILGISINPILYLASPKKNRKYNLLEVVKLFLIILIISIIVLLCLIISLGGASNLENNNNAGIFLFLFIVAVLISAAILNIFLILKKANPKWRSIQIFALFLIIFGLLTLISVILLLPILTIHASFGRPTL